ncbi:MAG: ATP-binding protein [Candidatus Polarisedimenticolia bacterium]
MRRAACLEIVTPDGFTKVVPIPRSPFGIGSAPTSDLRLENQDLREVHARIVLLGAVHHLVPDGPAPVTLDGVAVPEGGAPLAHGARIALAPSRLVLRFLLEEAGTGPPHDRGDRLLTLMQAARGITSSLAIDEVLERILEGSIRVSGAERGYLFLREGATLVPRVPRGESAASVEVSRSVAEEVAKTGRPVYRDFVEHGTQSASDSVVRLRLRAVLCVPLSVHGDILGVVYLDSRRPVPHHQPDLPLLEALANLAAIAIQNSRLVDERVSAERTLVMGQMARAVVHDLRAPLAAIRGIAELLREKAPAGDPSRTQLATLIAEADRLAGITADLLQFSSQAPPLQMTHVRLAELLRQVLRPLEARLSASRVEVRIEAEEETRARLDVQRMLRVLHNLAANALEAMPGGGTLTLQARRTGGTVRISVGDTGHGMSEATRARAFEPFFTQGKTQGTGLGLAIVRRIVEEHGGSVSLHSSEGRGTEIGLEIPAEGADVRARAGAVTGPSG